MYRKTLFIVHAAVIAALYVVLTLVANALGLANYAIQVRFSEALTILPFFTPAAIPGLFAGCIISNLLTGCLPMDVIFGSLATLLGAFGSWLIAGHPGPGGNTSCSSFRSWLIPLPPIAANTLIVPFILAYVYRFDGSVPYFMLTVGAGEIISCGVLGLILLQVLKRYRKHIFSVNR